MVDKRRLDYLAMVQHGVYARRQLLEAGVTDTDIERMLRRRLFARVSPGVYVDHTGPLTPIQREWAAVLAYWPAALSHDSAVPGRRPAEIHLAVGVERNFSAEPKGIVIHRMANLDNQVQWNASPPVVRIDRAVTDVMEGRIRRDDIAGAYAVLTEACFRRTNPDRVERALSRRTRVTGRRLIAGMIADLREGACSVLERGYLTRVERAHGLPRGRRQYRSLATGCRTLQDVRYDEYGLIVEPDGRAVHDNARSWDADARRDLAELATTDARTARVTYGLVFGGQCETARWIGQILQRQGWAGEIERCPLCPPGV